MATTNHPRLTPARCRRFGLEIGGLMLVVGGTLARSGARPRLALSVALIGGALAATAVARPTLLEPGARWWMALATRLSRVTTPILLSVVYLVALTPMAWLRRTVGRSPIARDRNRPTYWVRREQQPAESARSGMEHQF